MSSRGFGNGAKLIDVLEYIVSKGIEFKSEGNELVIPCPYCGKQKLYINRYSGKYHCFVCQAENPTSPYVKGHISYLQEMWGDIVPLTSVADRIEPNRNQKEVDLTLLTERYHAELRNNKNAYKYLAIQRGFTDETIDRFKLGYVRMHDHDWISIPSYEEGVPKLLKYRQVPPETQEKEKYVREFGSKSILFNGDILEEEDDIFVCEGEFDTISLIQAGYENAVGVTGGAGTLLPQWYDKLVSKRVTLIFDKDDAGQNAARDVWATRLGIHKCWNVILTDDVKDVNEFFLKYTPEKFNEILSKAGQFKIKGISSLKEALYELYRRGTSTDTLEKFQLPWNNVNKLLNGGFARQRLTVIGGSPGAGKTSISLQILHFLAITQNVPGLFFCMEMPETSLAVKIVQLHFDLANNEVNPNDALVYAEQLTDVPIYFGYSSKITPKIFYNTMVEARNRYGIQFGVFDNLQRLVRTGEEKDMSQASGIFKDITMDLDLPFVLISHFRKINEEEKPTIWDLKGSGAIPADSDETILMYRKRTNKDESEYSLSPSTTIIVDKSRFSAGGSTRLYFQGDKSKFIEEE